VFEHAPKEPRNISPVNVITIELPVGVGRDNTGLQDRLIYAIIVGVFVTSVLYPRESFAINLNDVVDTAEYDFVAVVTPPLVVPVTELPAMDKDEIVAEFFGVAFKVHSAVDL